MDNTARAEKEQESLRTATISISVHFSDQPGHSVTYTKHHDSSPVTIFYFYPLPQTECPNMTQSIPEEQILHTNFSSPQFALLLEEQYPCQCLHVLQ